MRSTSTDKRLFVCTKPYQYLLARLIKQGCGFDHCDIVILNHFYEAADFSYKVRETGIWDKVLFIDDGTLDQFKLKMNPVRKFVFYHSWRKYLPPSLTDITRYAEVFLAHDFVAVEYAIIRKFNKEGKRSYLYEEGFGNYINNSTHTKWHMQFLKKIAPWFGLPGGYFGSLRWINSVWLQRPELIISDRKNPLRNKTKALPISFKEYLQMPQIIDECYRIYPELHEIDGYLKGREMMSIVLTEPFLDEIAERKDYLEEIVARVGEAVKDKRTPIFFKQHPGEKLSLEGMSAQVVVLPKKLPIELIYLVMIKNDIRKVNAFSFGSTAILNLFDLCRSDDSLDIFIIESMGMLMEDELISSRFRELAEKYHIRFETM